MKKLRIIIILCLMFIGIGSANAFDNSLKMYDYAQVLTDKEETALKTKIDKYINTYQMDMVLVAVRYHSKSNIEEYTKAFYQTNNFGTGLNKDGIIFVLDLSKGESYILVTGKAVKIYDSNRINKINSKIDLKSSSYNIFNTFITNADKFAKEGVDYSKYDTKISVDWIKIILTSFIIPTVILVILILRNKMIHKKNDADYYLVDGSLVINTREDKFITTDTTQTIINNNTKK